MKATKIDEIFTVDLTLCKTVTPKNEERRPSEMLSFYSKKTAFHSGVSLHFRATIKRYGFSKCQIDSEDFVNFCDLLRKYELYLVKNSITEVILAKIEQHS